ncbi:hypothetical protein [Candidatus Phytoplasma solani]|uniref:Uncharacterized protein n=1 Tax=Candidatus Phytoplasma solani TaxID=69896 RepID=A0A421NXF4_9MOLU|nr:hypothetical protein [Candidatus Phytoplasma solani]RMI88624.1 hypothetical protein PSSA1_v1c4470 [Candidatus Phytoplasma solani]
MNYPNSNYPDRNPNYPSYLQPPKNSKTPLIIIGIVIAVIIFVVVITLILIQKKLTSKTNQRRSETPDRQPNTPIYNKFLWAPKRPKYRVI